MYKLSELESKYKEIEKELLNPDVISDKNRYTELTREYNNIKKIINEDNKLKKIDEELKEYREMLDLADDEALGEDINREIERLQLERDSTEKKILLSLLPEDPLSGKNIIMEIRAGIGGDEAALFAADLFRMYSRYCERKGWKIEHLSSNEIGVGGFKEIIFSISGNDVYQKLKFEVGVHRVQRCGYVHLIR